MKKIIILTSFALCLSCVAQAQVIWSADPSKSTNVNDFFRRFDSGNYPTDFCYTSGDQAGVTPSKVTTPNDPVYGKVWKVNKPKNRKRGEFARAEGDDMYYEPSEGDDIYLGWRWKIDTESGPKISTECTVWQWKSGGDHKQNYPLNMEYDGDLTLNAWGPDYAGNTFQSVRRTVLWRKAVPQDTWVSLVVRIKVDKDDFGGLVEFWFNGVKQKLTNSNFNKYKVELSSDKFTAFHRTNDGSVVYPKWGVYNKKSCSYNASAYFDEMKIGTTLNSVMPSGSNTPNQAPTSSMTSPNDGATFDFGETISLAANATDSDGSVVKVNFKVNGAYYSQDANGPGYTGTFTPTEPGIYILSARAFDDDDAQTENGVTITVLQPNRPPSGYFVNPTFNEIEEEYDELYVRIQDTDIDGDSVDITLYIDDVLIRQEKSGVFEWGHVTNSGDDFTDETLNLEPGVHTLKAVILDERGLSATITKDLMVKERFVTSISGKESPNIFVFPNPSKSGVFTLSEIVDYEVYDIQGSKVLAVTSGTVDLSKKSSGVYILHVGSKQVKLIR